MLNEGDKAPTFELPRDGDTTIRLSQFKGQPVVLYFYPKDDTSGCTKQAIGFTEKLAEFHDAGAEIIGVSPNSVKSHDKFRDKHELKIILVADEERQAIEAYGLWVEKKMYGRSYMGVDRSTFLIDKNGQIARIWRKVKIPGHVDEVLAAVKELD